jgi:hypothetical protein
VIGVFRGWRPAILVLLALAVAPAAAAAKVPRTFFGVMADNVLLQRSDASLASEFNLMKATRVGTVRIIIYWDQAQPDAPGTAAPARFATGRGGVPTDFGPSDRLMALAVARGMRVVPVVVGAPAWDREDPSQPASAPADDGPYADFLGTLVDRYGPHGSFWTEHPALPYRPQHEWQIWNEPDLYLFWQSSEPWATGYVRLLRAAHDALHQDDPAARVILGGLVNFSWKDLNAVYDAGGRGFFDVAAVHPFSFKVSNMLKIVGLVRQSMARHGDAKVPLMISELTWPSSHNKLKQKIAIETTERGQASKIRQALPALAAKRHVWHLDSVIWSTWLTPDAHSTIWWDWSGLRKLNPKNPNGAPVNKPAMGAFRAALRKLTR